MRIVFACFSAREVSWASGPAEDLIISLVVTPATAGATPIRKELEFPLSRE